MISSGDIVYSVGVGTDIAFDVALIRRHDVEIHAFDPTPHSIEWIGRQSLPDRFKFHGWGLSDRDGSVDFFPLESSGQGCWSSIQIHRDCSKTITVPVRRLATSMRELGHDRIDLLKLDIEGAEYAVIEDMLQCGILPTQLLVEFHHRFKEIGIGRTRAIVTRLKQAGYKLFYVSARGKDYSFLRLRARNQS
jgi:FkbM family methyltransferase